MGKSTLITAMNPELCINLSDEEVYFQFSTHFGELKSQIETRNPKTIFIDEIQRLPSLLNSIQSIIDGDKKLKFFLTGSSARKLKRGGANLLPGRVLNYYMGPLVASELNYEINTQQVLQYGFLPEIYLERNQKHRQKLLDSYVQNYVSQEIRAEALVKDIPAFSRSILVAIQNAGHFTDYSKLAKKAKVSRHSLSRFYEIFEDTMLGTRVWPFEPMVESADLIKHPKFFVFDNGVYNSILENYTPSLDRKGILCEHVVFNQLVHSAWSRSKSIRVSSFRTRGGFEVDFIVQMEGVILPVEVKATDDLTDSDVDALIRFRARAPKSEWGQVFHFGNKSKKINGIWCHPWQEGLKKIGL